jgi:DNA polymerase-3 subunit epsilon/oligoribonuclease
LNILKFLNIEKSFLHMLGIFLDQETTGLDSFRHKLLEVAFKVVDLGTGEELAQFQSIVRQPEEVWQARDPNAILVNGFTQAELASGKSEREIGIEIIELFTKLGIKRGKAVFICQNPSFDRPFFSHLVACYEQEKRLWPYHWLDLASMYWALEVKKMQNSSLPMPEEIWLSKDHIAQSLKLPKEASPHKAMQGVDHLLLCYEKVVGFAPHFTKI